MSPFTQQEHAECAAADAKLVAALDRNTAARCELSYFPLAVLISRAQAEPILAKVAQHDEVTERCLASFRKVRADRVARGKYDKQAERTQAEIDAEELALFDRAEARAINSGAW